MATPFVQGRSMRWRRPQLAIGNGTVGVAGHVVGVDLNPGMLAVARAQPPARASAKVEWREGDAKALPCDNTTCDVVFCQQGLQFFPDKAQSLRDMHRVLVPEGRLALSVWRALAYNPYTRALAEVLERHVGADAGSGMQAPCDFGDAQALLHPWKPMSR
jgi:ubiquinone/menaquinone biosynthesis C-methylase UbiE